MKKQQKPFTFEDFRQGLCAVRCDSDTSFNWFMQQCKQKGMRWLSNTVADQFRPNCIPVYLISFYEHLTFSYMTGTVHGKPCYDASILMLGDAIRKVSPKKQPGQTVVLRSDGDTTTGYLKQGERLLRKSCARRNPDDKPDDLTGFMLAMLRLFEKDHKFEFFADDDQFQFRKTEPEIHDFGWAIRQLKQGRKLTRAGWNGKGQYIQLASAISYKDPAGKVVNADHSSIGSKAIAFVGTSGVQMGWLASQADMLAEDWELICDF